MDLNRLVSRHPLLVAALAVVASAGAHWLLLSRIETFPLQSLEVPARERFTPIEMIDVQPEPAPPEEALPERAPLDQPSEEMLALREAEGIWSELSSPEPLPEPAETLPLPPPPAAQVGEWPDAVVRQDVLAVSEMQFGEDISALPRTWIDEDLPRIDRAPDIQLPVMLPDDLETEKAFDAASVATWREGAVAGTPDWREVMGGRSNGVGGEALPGTPRILIEEAPVQGLEETPAEISSLQAIEDMLNVRVEGFSDTDGAFYFALEVERASEQLLPVQPRDILFIQDSSASMTPQKLDECRRGLKRWLDFMNPGDRFEIMGFSEEVNPCFGDWRPFTAENRVLAFQYIDKMRAVGNTDVFRSLQTALAVSQDPARTRLLVLVTDGRPTVGVMDSSAIIEGITRGNEGQVSIFAVGGGKQVNSFFLDLLSYRNRGEAVVLQGEHEIPRGMETWAGQLMRPVLTDLSYSFSRIAPEDIYPKQLTHLYLDRPLVIHGRIADDAGPLVFQVVGRSGANWHDFIFVVERDRIAQGSRQLRQQWAWQKIYHMIGDYLGGATPEKLETIQSFAADYGLVVPYGFSRAMPRR